MRYRLVVKGILLAFLMGLLSACDIRGVAPTASPTATSQATLSPAIEATIAAPASPTQQAKATPNSPGMAVPPAWARDAVLYQIFVRNFTPEGTLSAAEKMLPSLNEMGVNLIYLMPVHPIGMVKRKGTAGSPYSVRDYMAIDPALGTEADLKAFVDKAHSLKMYVIMDLVANHTSWDNVLTQQHPEWYKHGPGGSFVPPNPDWTDVIQLDHSQPGLLQYMTDMTTHYVRDIGVDGFRCDYSVGVPISFWLALRDALKEVDPDVFLLSENDEQALTAAFDATYDQDTYQDAVSAYLSHRPHILVSGPLSDHERFGDKRLRTRFLENHDHDRVAYTFRLGPEALRAVTAYLLTTDGIPFIENGQEVAVMHTISLFEQDKIDWAAGNQGIRDLFKKELAIRNANPALRHGDIMEVESGDPGVLAYVRRSPEQQVLVLVNFAEEQRHATPAEISAKDGKNLESGEQVSLAGGINMPAWTWRIIELNIGERLTMR